MQEKVTPDVIFKSRYVFSEKKFSEYINYIDRTNAVRSAAYPLYSVYTEYMDNGKKCSPGFNPESEQVSSLFTATKDALSQDDKQTLKEQFLKAQKNRSPMWQQVISFTNEFLEKYGLYDSRTGMLDEDKIREVSRIAMKEMLKDEKMEGAAVWSAAVHYNTDNIHVHIAIVEPTPTRQRKEFTLKNKDGSKIQVTQFKGNMNPKTFAKVKSKIVNSIVNRSVELTQINEIIRNNIVAEKRGHSAYRDEKLRGAFLNLYRQLPSDRRLWKYNMNALSSVRPQIDKFSDGYIRLYHRKELSELMQKLNSQQSFLQSVYGSGKEKLYKNYTKTKIRDLHTRMGNAVLRELRDYDQTIRVHPQRGKTKDWNVISSQRNSSHRGLCNLRKALKKDFTSVKNQVAFEKLQQDIEMDQDYEK
jgi:CRISPR/Cas system-associated endoribonuclease Cas2